MYTSENSGKDSTTLVMVLRQAEGPMRRMEEEDLRERAEGVVYRGQVDMVGQWGGK